MNARTLFVVADDMGLCSEVDAGILETVRAGTVTTVDVLVNLPSEPGLHHVAAAGASLGLHLNLNLGCPCSAPGSVPSLIDDSGCFLARREEMLARLRLEDAERELRRQMERFRECAGQVPCHLSFHKHLHAHDSRLLDLAATLARECGAPLRTLDRAMRDACRRQGALTTDHFLGDVRPAPYWTLPRLGAQLTAIPFGLTELMCHPGRNVGPIAGLWYLAERDTERETFCSPEARALLSELHLAPCTPALFGSA
ncbi:MAG: ChbG/HpnK family deacetylase [Planctomycetota bacterium]